MHKVTIFILLIILNGCSSSPPPPPEPVGEMVPVNPEDINLSDLYIN